MTYNFQNEIPKSRVNITLNLDVGDAKRKKELPLKLLVLGDFSHGKNEKPINLRERIAITKDNFDKVISELLPKLSLIVPNTIKKNNSDLRVNLQFKQLKDFHPEQIVNQVQELKNLLAMRNLLKDLRANVIDNSHFRRELEKIIKGKNSLQELQKELAAIAPIDKQ